jgi:hypothetical protein
VGSRAILAISEASLASGSILAYSAGMAIRQISATPDSNIAQVAYDDATSDLYIQFQRAGTIPYKYKQVPVLTAEGFENGEKANSYFRAAILNQYLSEKVDAIPQQ